MHGSHHFLPHRIFSRGPVIHGLPSGGSDGISQGHGSWSRSKLSIEPTRLMARNHSTIAEVPPTLFVIRSPAHQIVVLILCVLSSVVLFSFFFLRRELVDMGRT